MKLRVRLGYLLILAVWFASAPSTPLGMLVCALQAREPAASVGGDAHHAHHSEAPASETSGTDPAGNDSHEQQHAHDCTHQCCPIGSAGILEVTALVQPATTTGRAPVRAGSTNLLPQHADYVLPFPNAPPPVALV